MLYSYVGRLRFTYETKDFIYYAHAAACARGCYGRTVHP